MRTAGKEILIRFQKRWQLMLWLEIFLYAIGSAVLVAFIFQNLILTISVFMLIASVFTLVLRPWQLDLQFISSYLDSKLETVEYSTGLLLLPPMQLSGLAQLQQQKVSHQLSEQIKTVQPETRILSAGITAGALILIGFLVFQFGLIDQLKGTNQPVEQEEIIVFKPADSITSEARQPVLESQEVTISYPAYTGIPAFSTSEMDIKAVEGSRVTWKISFDTEVDSAKMESMGSSYPMALKDGSYSRTSNLNNSGFYNFRFTDTLGGSYISDLYAIEVNRDRSPVIGIEDLDQFTTFEFEDDKRISFNASVTDDFGVADAHIIATVSKGTGESVKFREEKLGFEESVQSGSKNLKLSKRINLDDLKMEPGDELYFYVEASDLKQPRPNVSRSETYFAVIKDTTSYRYEVEGSLGVDLMPDYFRSQRQLIIDTEKLISNRQKLPKSEFNSTSNELGFDQKALRLKYGQFMGDETESDRADERTEMPEQDQDHQDEDPLAEFMHDHDGGENGHNLVEQEEEHEDHEEGEDEDPLGEFLHNHSDPEESTLFTDSLKSKLRQALDIMWDAELHLRLYEPVNSLPYQYQALALIQEIKNSARIYVHRIGFDPPPIKEDVRLTGEIKEVSSSRKQEEMEEPEQAPFMRQSILRLEQLISKDTGITAQDRKLFEQAGNELAEKAIEEPGKHLKTLQQLKWLSEERKNPAEMYVEVQRGLLLAIPDAEPVPGRNKSFTGDLNELLLKELELNDR